jgi:flagellar biosynthesis regulator FlbT
MFAQFIPIDPDIIKTKTKTDTEKSIQTTIKEEIFTTKKTETAKPNNTKTIQTAAKIDLKFIPSGQILIQNKIIGRDNKSAEIRQVIYIIWQSYIENSKENGYEHNDLARAISYAIFANYRVLNDTEEVPKENVKKLYEQIKEVFSDNADIGKMTNMQKQELAENLVFSAGLSVALAMAAEENEDKEMDKQAKDLAKKNLEELLGVSAFKLKITASGLEEK